MTSPPSAPLPEVPTDAQLYGASPFEEPLAAVGHGSPAENRALATALREWAAATPDRRDAVLDAWMGAHPGSPWRSSLLVNLGIRDARAARFGRALRELDEAWTLTRADATVHGVEIADRAVSELVDLRVRLGQTDEVEPLFEALLHRPARGASAEKVNWAWQTYAVMKRSPTQAFRCGIRALARVRAAMRPGETTPASIQRAEASPRGTSLADLTALARRAGIPLRMAFRSPGAPVMSPAVVHWKPGHYAALMRDVTTRSHATEYTVEDPSFDHAMQVSAAVLDEEGSGYFLVPSTRQLPTGWRDVSETEGAAVLGRGPTDALNRAAQRLGDLIDRACGSSFGMAQFGFHGLLAAIHVQDTPIWVNVPYGPPISFTVTYNQADSFQTELPSMGGFGPKWGHNWRQFVQPDVSMSGEALPEVRLFLGGGGYETYTFAPGSSRSFPERQNRSVLVKLTDASTGALTGYRHEYRDGSEEWYERSQGLDAGYTICYLGTTICESHSHGATWLLTRVKDPQGNAVSLTYDPHQRLTRITDASGLNYLALTYRTILDETSPEYYLIDTISTSDGRSARFDYTTPGSLRLQSITDMAGLVSSFSYRTIDRNDTATTLMPPPDTDFLGSMTTPYGTTTFDSGWWTENDNARTYIQRWAQATSPDQLTERVEFRQFSQSCAGATTESCYGQNDPLGAPQSIRDFSPPQDPNLNLNWRNTFYWDARAFGRAVAVSGGTSFNVAAYAFARNIHWLHQGMGAGDHVADGVPESESAPERSRVWYHYEGQDQPFYLGPTALLNRVTRKIGPNPDESGTSFAYNTLGNITRVIDPMLRRTTVDYYPNGIDVQGISVDNVADASTIENVFIGYNYENHLPKITVTGAGSRTTYFTYNRRGQPLSVKRPDGLETHYEYEFEYETGKTEGRLLREITPLGTTAYTHNPRGLIETVTTPEGMRRTYAYDGLDRVRSETADSGARVEIGYQILSPTTGAGLDYGDPTHPRIGLEPTTITDQEGRTERRSYDAAHRLVRHEDAAHNVTRYTWCCSSGIETITDALGHVTRWERASARRDGVPTALVRADGTRMEFSYDLLGRLQSVTDARHDVRWLTYKADGRVATSGSGLSWNWFEYDPLYPRVVRAGRADLGGSKTDATYNYSHDGTLASVDGPYDDDTVYYQYDFLGRRAGRSIGSESTSANRVHAYRDALDRIDHIDSSLGTAGYIYRASPQASVLDVVTHPDGSHSQYDYEPAASDLRTSHMVRQSQDGTIYANIWLGYTAGNRLSYESMNEAYRYYAYDAAARLQVGDTWSTLGGWHGSDWESYNYDAVGNRTYGYTYWELPSVTWDGWTSSFDAGNRVQWSQHYSGFGAWYSHDDDGNLQWDFGANRSYGWDAFNRLTSITRWGGSGSYTTTLSYDALGRVRSISEDGVERRLIWDGDMLIEERDASNVAVRRLFPEGFSQGGQNYYYVRDARGSVIGLTNAGGAQLKRWTYGVWGVRRLAWEAPGTSGLDAPVGFAGYLIHQPTGLYLTPSRVYDPTLGRWLNRDPAGERDALDGRNLHSYAANDPVNYVDPGGQFILPALGMALTLASFSYNTYEFAKALEAGDCQGAAMSVLGMGMDLGGALSPMLHALPSGGGSSWVGGGVQGVGGYAVVYGHKNFGHFSVEVGVHGGGIVHTHFDFVSRGSNMAGVSEYPRGLFKMFGRAPGVRFELPNARAAQEFQRSLLGQPPTQWEFLQNCCATHVTDVVSRGGGPTINPSLTGGFEAFWQGLIDAGGTLL